MTLTAILAFLLIYLLGLVANKLSSPVYYGACVLTILACLYIAYFSCDLVYIFYNPVQVLTSL